MRLQSQIKINRGWRGGGRNSYKHLFLQRAWIQFLAYNRAPASSVGTRLAHGTQIHTNANLLHIKMKWQTNKSIRQHKCLHSMGRGGEHPEDSPTSCYKAQVKGHSEAEWYHVPFLKIISNVWLERHLDSQRCSSSPTASPSCNK